MWSLHAIVSREFSARHGGRTDGFDRHGASARILLARGGQPADSGPPTTQFSSREALEPALIGHRQRLDLIGCLAVLRESLDVVWVAVAHPADGGGEGGGQWVALPRRKSSPPKVGWGEAGGAGASPQRTPGHTSVGIDHLVDGTGRRVGGHGGGAGRAGGARCRGRGVERC